MSNGGESAKGGEGRASGEVDGASPAERSSGAGSEAHRLALPGQAVPGGADWSEAPGLVARGVCMGSADVVPGVSGGTMALVLGIYPRLIRAIRSFDREALGHLLAGRVGPARDAVAWRFLLPILIGQALGIVLFTAVIELPKWLRTHPEPIRGLFFGLIVGSVVLLGRDLHRGGMSGRLLVSAAAGAAFGFAVVQAVGAADTPEARWFVFLCGCIAISAMILPGLSGSYILLILGQYTYILGGVGEFIRPAASDRASALLDIVAPFALGCLVGIVLFSRLLSWLLARAQRATLAFMTGLMVGSLWVIWPYQEAAGELAANKPRMVPTLPTALDGTLALAVGLGVAGFVGVLVLERVARRRLEGGLLSG